MFLPLGRLLDDSIKRAKIKPEVEATLAMEHFRQAANRIWGRSLAEGNIRAAYIKNGCLSVAVLNNLYAQEISLREKELIEEINSKMRKMVVTKIRCLI